MRLKHRSKHGNRAKTPRIAISQAEITADLQYPAGRPSAGGVAAVGARRIGAR